MEVIWWQATAKSPSSDYGQIAQQFIKMLNQSEMLSRCEGALGCIELLRRKRSYSGTLESETIKCIADALVPLLFSEIPMEHYVAGWGLSLVGMQNRWIPPSEPDVLGRMYTLWQQSPFYYNIRNRMAFALSNHSLRSRDDDNWCASINRSEFDATLKRYNELDRPREKPMVLVLSWYLRAQSDEQIAQQARALLESDSESKHPFAGFTLMNIFERITGLPALSRQ